MKYKMSWADMAGVERHSFAITIEAAKQEMSKTVSDSTILIFDPYEYKYFKV